MSGLHYKVCNQESFNGKVNTGELPGVTALTKVLLGVCFVTTVIFLVFVQTHEINYIFDLKNVIRYVNCFIKI